MYIYPDEYLQLIDSIHDLQLTNEGFRTDNITLGKEILRQRDILHSYQKENLSPSLTQPKITQQLPSQDLQKPVEEKKVSETPKKTPSQNRIPLNEVLEYLNESERKVCEQIQHAVEANNEKLIDKINEIKLKESRKTNKSSSSSASLKNKEFNQLATQMKALYKIWLNTETQPSNTQLLKWINDSNAEVRTHSQQISSLIKKMDQITSHKVSNRSIAQQKRNSHDTQKSQIPHHNDQHKISINIKSPIEKLKKKSILKRQSLLNKKTQLPKSKQKDPKESKVLIKDSKKSTTKMKDSGLSVKAEKSKPKKQSIRSKTSLLATSKINKKGNEKSSFAKNQPRQSKISKVSKVSGISKISKAKPDTLNTKSAKRDDKIISKNSLAVSKKSKKSPQTPKDKASKKKKAEKLSESRCNESYIISECGEANFHDSQWLNSVPL